MTFTAAKEETDFTVPVLGIIGVGLIGGSLALGLKKAGVVGRVLGYGRNPKNLQNALSLGVIDEIAPSPAAAAQADIVIMATPVGAFGDLLDQIVPELPAQSIVSDVGSVKHGVASEARARMGKHLPRFIPAHPVAGKEHSGVEAASADLYQRHKVVLTPLQETDPDALNVINAMWRSVGAEVVNMNVAEHDRVLAMTSHLPHVLAYTMVDFFAAAQDREKCFQMVAGGFYDFTRVASSDPVMWRDICDMNQAEVLAHIRGYQDRLGKIAELIENKNLTELEGIFSQAREARALITERRQNKLASETEPEAGPEMKPGEVKR